MLQGRRKSARDGQDDDVAAAESPPLDVSDEIIRLAIEASPIGTIIVDVAGRIVLVNGEAERMFGYPRAEVLGRSIDMLVPTALRPLHGALRASFVERPETRRMGAGRDLYGLRKDNTEIPIEIGLNPIHTRDGLMVLAAVADITERRMAEDKFRIAVEASPIGKIMTDAAGKIVLVNAEAERLFGYRRDELIGQSVDILVPASTRPLHGQHRAGFAARPEARRMGEGRDLHGLRKDGEEIPIEIALNPIHTVDGLMVLTSIIDISERKRAALVIARRTEELQRSNADLEQFAYVASHDLQEPLRMVTSYTELLAERYHGQLDEQADKYINYAVDGAKRMQRLIKDLLAFSRIGTQGAVFKSTDADRVVKDVLASLNVAIDESGAEIVCADLPAVRADEVQLRQLLQNLIGNAVKFRAERRPQISIGARRQSGEWVFHVADNGIGIDSQYSERIFQMFQRLHERGRYDGSGIGLAIAKKIVERHGGRIWFESEPATGTTFFFSLPDTPGEIP
jgi:PAS domain S-box-containing protein